jgi:hypothetical protein
MVFSNFEMVFLNFGKKPSSYKNFEMVFSNFEKKNELHVARAP